MKIRAWDLKNLFNLTAQIETSYNSDAPLTQAKKGGYGSFDLDFGLCVYQHQQSKVDELQKRVDELIQYLNERGDKAWAVWESSAEMYEQGRADVFWQVANDLE